MKPIKNNFKYITMNKKTFLFASALAMCMIVNDRKCEICKIIDEKSFLAGR